MTRFLSLFSLCGFRDSLTFSKVGRNQIDLVENFIKTKLPSIVSIWKANRSENASDLNDVDFFGPIYVYDKDSFEFSPGDHLQISSITSHVKEMLRAEPQYFKRPDSAESNSNTMLYKQQSCSKPSKSELLPKFESNSMRTINTHLLTKINEAAKRNAMKKPGGFRYDSCVKSFVTYHRMESGRLAYKTLQSNLTGLIPSLPSTNRYIQTMNYRVIEAIPRFDELNIYLESRKLPKIVSLSEDATRIVGRVQYDRKTNQVIGFTPPLDNESGMPVPFLFPARNSIEMISYFENDHTESESVIAVMAQPFSKETKHSFCLMLFGANKKYTGLDVANRWSFMIDALKNRGIVVLNVSSDSDTKYNAAMRKLSQLGKKTEYFENLDWFREKLEIQQISMKSIRYLHKIQYTSV